MEYESYGAKRAREEREREEAEAAAERERDNSFMMNLHQGPDPMELNFLHDAVRDAVKAIQQYQEDSKYLAELLAGRLRGDEKGASWGGHVTASVEYQQAAKRKNEALQQTARAKEQTAGDLLSRLIYTAENSLKYDAELMWSLQNLDYDGMQLTVLLEKHSNNLLDCRRIMKYAKEHDHTDVYDAALSLCRKLENESNKAIRLAKSAPLLRNYLRDVIRNTATDIDVQHCCDLDNGITG